MGTHLLIWLWIHPLLLVNIAENPCRAVLSNSLQVCASVVPIQHVCTAGVGHHIGLHGFGPGVGWYMDLIDVSTIATSQHGRGRLIDTLPYM